MKILLVAGSFPPLMCGVGDYTMQLALALSKESGADVQVLTSQSQGKSVSSNRLAVSATMLSWRLHEAYKAFRFIRDNSPDIVHIQFPTQGYGKGNLPPLLPIISRLAGARVVQTWHEPIHWREPLNLLLRCLVRAEVIVVRPAFRAMLNPPMRLLLKSKRLHYISGASALPVSTQSVAEREKLRLHYLGGQSRLLVFFGFIYPAKGLDLIFEIADPEIDHIVVAGEFGPDRNYKDRVVALSMGKWAGKVTFTGFLTPVDAASLLSAADAVVLPFRQGGGDWNSSIHGAVANGAYVVTTSNTVSGYDSARNVAYAPVGDLDEMRRALTLSDCRRNTGPKAESAPWDQIAARHMEIYRTLVAKSSLDGALV